MITLELISTVAATMMSTIVSVVALVFSYRQNAGWKPLVLVTNTSMTGIGGSQRYTFNLTVEFWNRRKYPVALRSATADLTGVIILDSDPPGRENHSYTKKNRVYLEIDAVVPPATSHEVTFAVTFENQSLDAMRPIFDIRLRYFDPQKSRSKALSVVHRFFFPDLGWKRSDAERGLAVNAFREMHRIDEPRAQAAEEKARFKEAVRRAIKGGDK